MATTGGGLNLPAVIEVKVVGLQRAERDMERFGYRSQAAAKAAIPQPAGPPAPKALPAGAIAQPGAQQFKAIGMGSDPYGLKQANKELNELRTKYNAFQARLGQAGRTQDVFNTRKAKQDLADLRRESRATQRALPSGSIAQPGAQQYKAIGVGADPHGFKQAAKDLNDLQAKYNTFQARLHQSGRNQDIFNTEKAKQDLADLRRRKQELDQSERGLEPYRQQTRSRPGPIPGQQAIGAASQELDVYRAHARQRPFAGEIGAGAGGPRGPGGGGPGGGAAGFGAGGGPSWEPARGLGMDSIDRQIREMVKWAQRNAELYRRMALNNQGILDEQVKLKASAADYRKAYAKKFDLSTPGTKDTLSGKEATGALAGADYASRQRDLGQRAMTAELTLGRDASAGVWKRLEAGGTQREAATQHLEDQVKRQISIEQSKLALEEGTAQEVAQEKVLREKLNREIAAEMRVQTNKKEVAQENVAKRHDNIEQQREDIRATTPEDLGAEARLSVERQLQQAEQRLAENAEMRTAAGQRLLAAEAQLAAETAEIKAQAKQREAADSRLIRATANAANAEEERAARTTLARGGRQFEDVQGPALIARAAAYKQSQEVEKRTAVLRQITDADRETLARQKLLSAQERVQMRAVERRVFREAVESGEAGRGTWFQRVQTRLHPASGKLPEEQLTGREFIGEKFQRTLGFAVSGAAIGFGVAAIAEMFKDATQLEQTFVRLRGQMEGIGKTDSFPKVREQIKAIAADTGQASNEVAVFYSRMLGLSNDPDQALADTASAMKLATVTGLDMKTMMQSLVPIQKAFGISAEQIGDEVVAMGEKFGIAEDDLLQFLGKTASVAKNAGLNFKELTVIGATVANSLGRPIDASAEAINKAFGQIENNADKIFSILQSNPATQSAIPKMIEAMGAGESGDALIELLRASKDFAPGQRNAILKNVVSRREAEEFNALINNASSILDQLGASESGASDSTGKLNQRFGDLKSTVATTFKSLSASFEAIGDALFQSGIGDFLVDLGRVLGTVVTAAGAVLKIFGSLNEVFAPFGVPLLSTLLKMAAVAGVLIKVSDVLIQKKRQSSLESGKEAAAEKLSEQQKRAAANTTVYFSGTKEQSATASVHETAAERENTTTKQGLTNAATETAAAETNLARAKTASAAASQAQLLGLGPAGRGGPLVPFGAAGGPAGPGGLGAGAAGSVATQAGMLGLLGFSGRTRVSPAQYARAGGLPSGMQALESGMLALPVGAGRGVARYQPRPEIGAARTRIADATYAGAQGASLGWGSYAVPPPRMLTQAQRAGALAVTESATAGAEAAARGARQRLAGDLGGSVRMGGAGFNLGGRLAGDAGGTGYAFRSIGARTALDYGAERALFKRMGDRWTTELAPGGASRLAQRRLVGYGAQRTMANNYFADELKAGRPVTAGLGTRALAGGGLFGTKSFKFAKADAQTAAAGEKALGSSPLAIAAIVAAGVVAVQGAYETQAAATKTNAEYARSQLKKADQRTLKELAGKRADLWTTLAGAIFSMPTEQEMAAQESAFAESTDARKALGFVTRPDARTAMDETRKKIDESNSTIYKKMWESYSSTTQQGMVEDLKQTSGGRKELRDAGIIQRTLPVIDLIPKPEGFWGAATKFGGRFSLAAAQDKYNELGDQVLTETNTSAEGYAKLMGNLRGRDDEVSSRAADTIAKWQAGEGDKPDFANMAKELARGGNVLGAIDAAGGNVGFVLNSLDTSQGETFKSLDELAQEYQAGKITAADYKTQADRALSFVNQEAEHFQGDMGAKARAVVTATTKAVDDAMLKARVTAENVTTLLATRGSLAPKNLAKDSLTRLYAGAPRQTRLDNLQTMVQANIEATDEKIAGIYNPEERLKAFAAGVTLDDTTYQTRLQAEMASSPELDAAIGEIAPRLGMDKDAVSDEITARAAKTGEGLTVAANEWLKEKVKALPKTVQGSFKAAAVMSFQAPLLMAAAKIPDVRTEVPSEERTAIEAINNRAGQRKAQAKVLAADAQGDNLRTAALNTQEAYHSWQDMIKRSKVVTPEGIAGATEEQVKEAYAEYLSTRKTEAETLFGFSQTVRNRAVILAKGDPVKATAAQMSIAQAELSRARQLGDKERTEKAVQSVMQLQQQEEENALNIIRGRMTVQAALVSEDPLASARKALEAAEFELGQAQGDADREQKQAAVIQAQKGVNNAISAGLSASANLAITLANLRGDSVAAATLSANEAKRQLDEAIAKGVNDEAVLAPLRGAVEEMNKAKFLAPIQKQISDLDYLYGLEQMSLGNYVAMLTSQRDQLVYDSQEYRDLNLKIFNLKKSAQQDMGFNLPGQIQLPTLYEARRLNQSNAMGVGYMDNRNVQVTFNVDGAQDPTLVATQIMNALDGAMGGGQLYTPGISMGSVN